MPKKILELTVEIEIQSVTCPGVWLCPNGQISLTVFTLGTSYQTCCLPPTFPLQFRDLFYFRKRFQKICSINDMQLLLHEEMIYCELVQWVSKCDKVQSHVLAQYLGTLNELLFPPQMCSNDGIDLLMRSAKHFPGILSPKIEVATKLRIDEIWDNPLNGSCDLPSIIPKGSRNMDVFNKKHQKRVCHSTQYHGSPLCTAKIKNGCTSKCKIDRFQEQRDPVPRNTYAMDHKFPHYTAQVQTSLRPRCVQKNCYMAQEVSEFQCSPCQERLPSQEVCNALFADQAVSIPYNDFRHAPYNPSIESPNYFGTHCNQQPTITRLESNEFENFRDRERDFLFSSTANKPIPNTIAMNIPSDLTRIGGEIGLNMNAEKECCKGTNKKKQREHKSISEPWNRSKALDCSPCTNREISNSPLSSWVTRTADDQYPMSEPLNRAKALDCSPCTNREISNSPLSSWVTRPADDQYPTNDTVTPYSSCDPRCGTFQTNPIEHVEADTAYKDAYRPGRAADRSVANDMCLDSKLQTQRTCPCRKYLSLNENYSYRKLSTPVPYTCEICKKYEMLFNNNENIKKCCGWNFAKTCCRR